MTSRRKFIAVLSAGVSWAAIARAATFTGSGVDDQGNTITFTLTETITPASLYVAANGNDNNNGKSPSAPFQTIAKINSLVLAHGSSVLFNGGDTFAGNLLPNIDGNGDPNNPVIIGSYGTGQATLVNCLAENNCRGGLPGFGEITINLPGASDPTITVQKNTTFNNRVYTGQQFHNDNQGAVGIAVTGGGVFQGTISKNIIVTNVDIYGESTPLNARTNTSTFTPAVEISNNDWWQQSGGLDIWWANTQYFTLANWQTASDKGANTQLGNPNFSAPGPAGHTQMTFPGWGATPQSSYGST